MKIHLLIILFLTSFILNAQEFSGRAVYKTHQKTNIKLDSAMVAKNPGIQKMMEEKLKQMYQQTYVLEFNKKESTYKQKAKLDQPNPQASRGGVMVMSFGSGGGNDVLYKNIAEKRYADKTEIMSKPFLVKDQLNTYDWELTGKTKTIGTYTVYEAKWTRDEENINMTMVNGDMKETVKTETRTTTAWYTMEIPVSNGPGNWWGLPGLILEVNDGRRTIVCIEIELNPKNAVDIEEPSKGKIVNQEDYERISREKTKEFMERNRSRDGKSIRINIGG